MILCKHCGWPVSEVEANCFHHDGSDSYNRFPVNESDGAVCFSVPPTWCGAELSDEERMECIRCTHCKKFPFSEIAGIGVETIINVVCFEENA